MLNKYGEYSTEQFSSYKNFLHSKIHCLLIEKDKKCEHVIQNINIPEYINFLQYQLIGLNELLFHPPVIITLMNTLEAISIESTKDNFDWQTYRKLVLDAHGLVDKL